MTVINLELEIMKESNELLIEKCKRYDEENANLERKLEQKDREIEFLKRKYVDLRVHNITNLHSIQNSDPHLSILSSVSSRSLGKYNSPAKISN